VRAHGLPTYRRHHTGHAIGLEPYEPPTVAPGFTDPIEAGQTFCLETPYYELGWGGAMVEDAIVVTKDGCRVLNETPRTLWRAG
jgi:Xaa-Pro dipeptidase